MVDRVKSLNRYIRNLERYRKKKMLDRSLILHLNDEGAKKRSSRLLSECFFLEGRIDQLKKIIKRKENGKCI